jgi:hypothetical protein
MGVNKTIQKMKYKRVIDGLSKGEKLGEAVKSAGYSDSTAKKPSKITKKQTFQELLDDILPQEFVVDQHKRLYSEHRHLDQIRLDTLDDEKIAQAREGYENTSVIKNEEEGYTIIIINEVDRQARKDAIELAYKLRGSFAPDKIEVKRELQDYSDEELMALLKDKEDVEADDEK